MADIEKKAREYASEAILNAVWSDIEYPSEAEKAEEEDMKRAFLAGATYALGNQWRDAEKEKPERGKTVLIGYFSNKHEDYFDIAYQDEYGTWYSEISEYGYPLDCPTHWLPIPEYKPKGE